MIPYKLNKFPEIQVPILTE